MLIRDIFKQKKITLSFEVFPPKPTSDISTVYSTIEELSSLRPDFISVTYGAGGSFTDSKTLELSSIIKQKHDIEAIAHLTCISSSEEEISRVIKSLKERNIENVLALRGDIPIDRSANGSFNYATDLIKYIKSQSNLGISAACYPEGHVEGKNLEKSVRIMKLKEELGTDHFISQLFFSNNAYYDFMNRVYQQNIKVPIEAGIMPVTNRKQIERMVALSGASLPHKFLKIIDKYEHYPDALQEAGIAYAIDQIIDLVSSGARGIHLYTMNKPYVAKKITETVRPILDAINSKEEKEIV
ncbi:methylenetetrahydrofolate reductase [NAD(P)H] [Inconstantimicrobium mannanitabidum]|uniref:Methylenetetrahydrofolate reductase n=1 Tax=Inconstantimicrobium mannanitabidum TaxID=1604901 RepID=A0ACB5RCJ7_9CLOT|nr:methylenetetrahydrofolate reductase [NAD(P)H] [Clostridium sp. TW13]GKX66865.1 methylenetetrahydrofolate reductase [Clostridium sp. TW13]